MTVVRVNVPSGSAGGVVTTTVPVPVVKTAVGSRPATGAPVAVTTTQPLATATASQNAPQVSFHIIRAEKGMASTKL